MGEMGYIKLRSSGKSVILRTTGTMQKFVSYQTLYQAYVKNSWGGVEDAL